METQGRAQAVTVISPVRGWWAIWLRLTWPLADRIAFLKRPLVRLAFINVAHWSLLSRIPARGKRGSRTRPRRLPHPYLIFHTNFNDDLAAYVDAFAMVVPWRMRGMWQGVYGFPGPRIVDRFDKFVEDSALASQHYYCAYPHGSARIVGQALALSDRHRAFVGTAGTMSAEEFVEAWEEFVRENQLLL